MMTGMPASLAFFTAGMRAFTSEGARTIALTPRSMALSTMPISSLMLLSDWGPRKVTESFGVCALSSFCASMAPVCTFCQKLELPVLTMTAISPPSAGLGSAGGAAGAENHRGKQGQSYRNEPHLLHTLLLFLGLRSVQADRVSRMYSPRRAGAGGAVSHLRLLSWSTVTAPMTTRPMTICCMK